MKEGSDKLLKISLLMTRVRGSWGWVVRWLIHSLCKLVLDSGKVNQTDQRCWENGPGTSVTASHVLISFWLFPPLCLSSSERCLFNSDLVSRKVPKKKRDWFLRSRKQISPFELLKCLPFSRDWVWRQSWVRTKYTRRSVVNLGTVIFKFKTFSFSSHNNVFS